MRELREAHLGSLLGRCGPERFGQQGPPVWRRDFLEEMIAMIYAGVDVAKANHVIGAVGDDGQPLCKSMEFKNSDAGFERCSAWLVFDSFIFQGFTG